MLIPYFERISQKFEIINKSSEVISKSGDHRSEFIFFNYTSEF